MRKTIAFLLIINLSGIALFANTIDVKIVWEQPFLWEGKLMLKFEKASYSDENGGMPYFNQKIELKGRPQNAICKIENQIFEQFSKNELQALNQVTKVQESVRIEYSINYIKKNPFLFVTIYPVRKNSETGQFEKLVSFSLSYQVNESEKSAVKQNWAAHSVLASGNWYKIKINQTGLYKLTYDDLRSIGLEQPENVRIYGNSGYMSSSNNALPILDDLSENPIIMEKGDDQIFNSGDYIVFYGRGSTQWNYNTSRQMFIHAPNFYTSGAYYYITSDLGAGHHIINQPEITEPSSRTSVSFDDYSYHELNDTNFIRSGRTWFGEIFNDNFSYTFNFTFPNRDLSAPVKILTHVGARSSNAYQDTSYFILSVQSVQIQKVNVPNVSFNASSYVYGADAYGASQFNFAQNENIPVDIQYFAPSEISRGFLDYILLNVRKNLRFSSGQMAFRDKASVSNGSITEFVLSNANENTRVLDVTDPFSIVEVNGNFTSGTFSFKASTSTLKEFVAFDGINFLSPEIRGTGLGKMVNQDLHGIGATDYIIVTHPLFKTYADALCEFHKTTGNLRTLVFTTDQVYQEFSSGNPDPVAIRRLMKMLYDRASSEADMPKYLLLFGDGSYDNLTQGNGNTNFILTYQNDNSLSETASFTSDDFYSLLDDNESGTTGTEDIGVGRFPVRNTYEAEILVNKVIQYAQSVSLGDWRNNVTFIADDADEGQTFHMIDANNITIKVAQLAPFVNFDKIYLDAFTETSTSSGERYPSVTQAINNRMARGTLMMNFMGHGNPVQLTHEQVITNNEVKAWSNADKLPVFVTASCEVSRYDDFRRTSLGENILLNPNGGAVALFSTTRVVYADGNYDLNMNFCDYSFTYDETGKPRRLGDIIKNAKLETGGPSGTNKRNFCLLGDPAMRIGLPELNVITSHVNEVPIELPHDTLKALKKITIAGYVADLNGNRVTTFNGRVFPVIYDKKVIKRTLGNDGNTPLQYETQNNIIYKGAASVNTGNFEFTFIVPKDINYTFGPGKISYYSENGQMDGAGSSNQIIIGGSSDTIITDTLGPNIKLYMNNEKFVPGGTTNETPILLAIIADSMGINTTGNSIGHDITAMLDNDRDNLFVLNDYYQADLNSYQSGKVKFQFPDLDLGNHSVQFKVWDINNVSASTSLDFLVSDSEDFNLKHVLNYPNPFTTQTSFFFEHNQPNEDMDITVQIFTVSGKLIKTISTTLASSGFRSDPIPWDGKDDFGDPIGRGVYIYKIKAKTLSGKKAEKFEKLVILK